MENFISPVTHLLMSWLGAAHLNMEKRDRLLVSIAGISPDVDGLGLVVDFLLKPFGISMNLWGELHHSFHSLFGAILVSSLSLAFTKNKLLVFGSVFIAFHAHLLCDLVGSGGPGDYKWKIPYLSPMNRDWQLVWSGQWELNSWQNIVITAILVFLTYRVIIVKKITPLELMSKKFDVTLVNLLHRK